MAWFTRTKEAVAQVVEKAVGFFGADEVVPAPRHQTGTALMQSRLAEAKRHAPQAAGEFAQDADCQSSIKRAYADGVPGGEPINEVLFGWFASIGFMGYQASAFIAQHWLVRKACFMPGRDAIRQGYTITSDTGDDLDPKVLQEFQKQAQRWQLNRRMLDFVGTGRVYGYRLALFRVRTANPTQWYENPFNLDGVTEGSYEGISMIDPQWVSPQLDAEAAIDPTSPHFYEPTWWLIQGKKYHRSHFVIFRNGELPDVLKPIYQYGGLPLPQLIAERVYCAERTANEAPQLTMTKRLMVLGVNAAEFLANGEESLEKLRLAQTYRDNFQTQVIDKDGESVEQLDTSLADLDAVIMTQYQLVAAVAGVPATKLLGTTPKGFNATGEYDEKNYHEDLESLQQLDLSPFIERHHDLVMKSVIAPKFFDGKFVSTTTVWAPLDSPDAKEMADAQLVLAQRDAALVTAGTIDGADSRERLRKDRESGYYGISEAVPEDAGAAAAGLTMAEPGAEVLTGDSALDPVRIVSNQRHRDPAIVAAKRQAQDYTVQVSPLFVDEDGTRYRIVIDGHHSLEAAKADGVPPNFVEGNYGGSDYEVIADG